jgi:hypothetical protein
MGTEIERSANNSKHIKFERGDVLMAKKLKKGKEPFLQISRPVVVFLKYYESKYGKFCRADVYLDFDPVSGKFAKIVQDEIHVAAFMEEHFRLAPKGANPKEAVLLYGAKNK